LEVEVEGGWSQCWLSLTCFVTRSSSSGDERPRLDETFVHDVSWGGWSIVGEWTEGQSGGSWSMCSRVLLLSERGALSEHNVKVTDFLFATHHYTRNSICTTIHVSIIYGLRTSNESWNCIEKLGRTQLESPTTVT
jgi:hypothetical protein